MIDDEVDYEIAFNSKSTNNHVKISNIGFNLKYYTISMWVKVTSLPAGLFSFYNTTNGVTLFSLWVDTDGIVWMEFEGVKM